MLEFSLSFLLSLRQTLGWDFLGPCIAGLDKPVTDAALELNVRPVNDGLYSTLALSCGFAQPSSTQAPDCDTKPDWRFAIAIWSSLPADLPVAAVEVCTPQDVSSLQSTSVHSTPLLHLVPSFLPATGM